MSVATMINNLRGFLGGALNDNLINAAINRAYDGLLRKRTWSQALAHAPLNTLAPHSNGTVAVDAGSTSVTGANTAWTASFQNAFIRFASEDNYYEIANVANATAITLSTSYAGAANLAANSTYQIFKHIYTVPSDARQVLTVQYTSFLQQTSQYRINRANPDRDVTGEPSGWAPAGVDANGVLRIEVHPVPGAEYNLIVHYAKPRVTTLTANQTPLLPEPLVEAVALLWCYRMLASKSPEWIELSRDQAILANEIIVQHEMEDADILAGEDAARNIYLDPVYDRSSTTYTEEVES
jgi:hypothetical protein